MPRATKKIKINNQKIQDNLHQAGQELNKDAHNLGQSIQKGAHDLDQRVGPAARETLGDAALTTHVKARLIAAPDLGGIRIHVSSRDGQVTLSPAPSRRRSFATRPRRSPAAPTACAMIGALQ